MRRTCTVLALSLALAAAGRAGAATEIEPGIFRLDGLDENLPKGDLEPLARIVGNAEVVGLGEAVHTTAGFSRAKFRLFKYMVEELGFRVFGFESPWIAAEQTAEYVQDCQGSARAASGGLFGVWQNDSVRDLLRWMCEWNQIHRDDRVFFYGFDHQQGLDDLIGLRRRLLDLGLSDQDPRVAGLAECDTGSRLPSTQEEHETCIESLDAVSDFLDELEPDLTDAASVEGLAWARVHEVGLRSWENQDWYRDRNPRLATESRDSGMAFLATEIRRLRFPEAKTALWAHNFHIARGRIFGTRVMGFYLKRELRRAYRAVGLVAFEAATEWPGLNCGPWATAEPGSVEGLLEQLGEPFLLVDLDFPGGNPPFLERGRKYGINWGWELVPRKRFHGLVYMDSAERMEPLAWTPCTPD